MNIIGFCVIYLFYDITMIESDMFQSISIHLSHFYDRGVKIIPSLSTELRKGQMGRIGIIGGSPEYTGAPFYAGQSSLKFGADLAFIFCAEEAMIPIKSYSPELMVTSFYKSTDLLTPTVQSMAINHKSNNNNNDNINDKLIHQPDYGIQHIVNFFPRLHSIVIGPGLGRMEVPLEIVSKIIPKIRELNMPMIIDADGLFLVSNNLSLIKECKNCILTPNGGEYERLLSSAINTLTSSIPSTSSIQSSEQNLLKELQSSNIHTNIRALAQYLGNVTIIRKGRYDIVTCGGDVFEIIAEGSPRRCGGQGDIFTGILAVALHWRLLIQDPTSLQHHIKTLVSFVERNQSDIEIESNSDNHTPDWSGKEISIDLSKYPLIDAVILASIVTRKASELAFQSHRRSMTSPDIMNMIGLALEQCFPESI